MLILVSLIQWKLFIQTALEQGILFRGYLYCEGAFGIWDGSQDRETKHIELETSTFLDYSSTDKQLSIAVESLAYLMRHFCFRHCSILFDYERVKWRSTETEEYLLQITLSPTCSKFGL